VPEQWNDDDQAWPEEIITHLLVVTQEDIPDKVTKWFHVVDDEYC
jgi:hypothetical protein